MYGSRGAMLGSGGFSGGYDGTKRPRMMESNPYFAVNSSFGGADGYEVGSKRLRIVEPSPFLPMGGIGSSYQPHDSSFSRGFSSIPPFPVVRLRGLPFNCTDLDIIKFFMGLDIVDCLLVNKNGRFTGDAFVVFPSPMQADFALRKDRHNMGHRYIEVFPCSKQDYYRAVAAEVNSGGWSLEDDYYKDAPPVHARKSYEDKDKLENEVLKLRGLPYSVTKSDIIDFFGEFELSEDKVHIGYRLDGKATGEAFVLFPSEDGARKAMSKDKMTIGSRYVELFPSTHEEARRAGFRSKELNL
ncbi:heterogeneous nuclear ribonucleoprotein H2-like isoform X1 [Zingiber officinale]|uniref:heterogeneous nuclear ribonucleoprotein H2-like isoform X1 n=2 Tax=Zingiber officinale TaxID=94328 RepID=UPI001C4B5305|nr:heterogeneous nuclear ribonucleoprotein H2-like isoform X1 [Zingiber officinale]